MFEKGLPVGKRILLVLAFLADCLDEARLLGGLVGVTYKQVYGWIPPQYRRQNFYSQIRRFVAKGYVQKKREGRSCVLAITPQGRANSVSLHGHLWPENWDGFWTLALFDIREKSRQTRDSLRNFLKELRFGMFQRSVWVFPGDFVPELRRLIREERLQSHVLVVANDDLGIRNQRALAERIWCLSTLNKRYKNLIKEVEAAASFPMEKKAIKLEEFKERLLVLLDRDPMLPLTLLPGDWSGRKAIEAALFLEKTLS